MMMAAVNIMSDVTGPPPDGDIAWGVIGLILIFMFLASR